MAGKKAKKDKEDEPKEIEETGKATVAPPAKPSSPAIMNPNIPEAGNACPFCNSTEVINKGPNLPFKLGHISVSSLMGNKHGISIVICALCMAVYGRRED